MLGRLRDRGYDLVADAHQADVIVVNTCAFIDRAKQESVDTILEMAKEKETGRARRLVVTPEALGSPGSSTLSEPGAARYP